MIRHPAATSSVDDVDGFVSSALERIATAPSGDGPVEPPDHRKGRLRASFRAVRSWNRRTIAHEKRAVDRVELPHLDRAGDVDDQAVEIGVGSTFHRPYHTVVHDSTISAEAAMAATQADLNVLADLDLAPSTKVRGDSGRMRIGDRYVIEIAGPWKGALEVVDVTPHSSRLTTLQGHIESGVIDMRTSTDASDRCGADVAFTIESWARSHGHFLELLYDKLGIAKALQGEMWSIACDRFAELVHGEAVGPLRIVTERAS